MKWLYASGMKTIIVLSGGYLLAVIAGCVYMPEDDCEFMYSIRESPQYALAHELGHAAARHGNERIAYALIGAAGGVLFEEWVAGVAPTLDSGEGVSLIRLAYGIGGDVGFHLPRSRLQESEADRLGVRYLARAGFDPESMVRLFEWFAAIAPQDSDAFKQLFSTHPLHTERLAHVREVLRESDLREMPKETWRGKMKKKADEIDFTKVDPKGVISNAASRLPNIPWRRKPTEK